MKQFSHFSKVKFLNNKDEKSSNDLHCISAAIKKNSWIGRSIQTNGQR